DHGEPGTPVFALAGDRATYTAGLVHFDGKTVEIDVTGVSVPGDEAALVMQLLNSDADTKTCVAVKGPANVVDPAGVSAPVCPVDTFHAVKGDALDLSALTPTTDVKVLVDNVRFNDASGTYTADLRVRNLGAAAIGRKVAAILPGLPAGVDVVDPSG